MDVVHLYITNARERTVIKYNQRASREGKDTGCYIHGMPGKGLRYNTVRDYPGKGGGLRMDVVHGMPRK